MGSYTVIRTRKLIDGTGNDPIEFPVVVVENDRIVEVHARASIASGFLSSIVGTFHACEEVLFNASMWIQD